MRAQGQNPSSWSAHVTIDITLTNDTLHIILQLSTSDTSISIWNVLYVIYHTLWLRLKLLSMIWMWIIIGFELQEWWSGGFGYGWMCNHLLIFHSLYIRIHFSTFLYFICAHPPIATCTSMFVTLTFGFQPYSFVFWNYWFVQILLFLKLFGMF